MKLFHLIVGISILSSSILIGSDSINDQIEAIQKASPQERVELMNRLKIQLASMNQEERANAINALQTRLNSSKIAPMRPIQQMNSATQSSQRQGEGASHQAPLNRR